MKQFQCVDCARSFTKEGLKQHNRDKHGIQVEQVASKPQHVNTILQPKKFLSKIHKKRILKYSLLTLLGGLIIIALVHHFSTNKKSNNALTALALGETGIEISVGSKAPDFTLPSSTGNKISLSDYKGKKNVLLYFQEGVMCDPCWKQTLDIQKEYDKFQSKDIELLTITVDPLNAITKNAKRFGITLPILEDADLKVSTEYDALKNSMHPGSRPGHTFFLVGKDGKILWKKEYYIASGSTKMTMNMNGRPMTMDMGMDMGTQDSVMYLPVNKLLADIEGVNLDSTEETSSAMKDMQLDSTMQDHTMCLTPIHKHADLKIYLDGNQLNLSKREYMDQSNEVHLHPTVKVRPEDTPNIPFGDMMHMHKESILLKDFLNTLDFDIDTSKMLSDSKVYINGILVGEGLNYVIEDKDRILITNSVSEIEIAKQIASVTNYGIQGRDSNPSLFGGC